MKRIIIPIYTLLILFSLTVLSGCVMNYVLPQGAMPGSNSKNGLVVGSFVESSTVDLPAGVYVFLKNTISGNILR